MPTYLPIPNAKPEHFKVGKPSTQRNWTNPDCQRLTDVSHVTHVANAVSIAREGILRPRLVFDESKLNQTRTLVNWLSPNYWNDGSRYGTIELHFDWPLAKERDAYWVEAIDYRVTACRILLTSDKKTPQGIGLAQYDPSTTPGPWKTDSKAKHWWNGDHCLELMVHDELSVEAVTRVSFVNHHRRWCSLHRNEPKECIELGLKAHSAGAQFIASIVGEGLHTLDHALIDDGNPCDEVVDAFQELINQEVGGEKYKGTLKSTHSGASAVARSLLLATARRSEDDRLALLRLFRSEDDAVEAVQWAVAEHLGVPPDTLDDD